MCHFCASFEKHRNPSAEQNINVKRKNIDKKPSEVIEFESFKKMWKMEIYLRVCCTQIS